MGTPHRNTRWTPRTPHEALTLVDTILAPIVPTITHTQQSIADLIPIGGQPAGNGNPGGGSHSISSPTERTALGTLPTEARDLDTLKDLCITIHVESSTLLLKLTGFTQPVEGGPARMLAWARWAVRRACDYQPNRLKLKDTKALVHATYELEHLVHRWTIEPSMPNTPRSIGLAADDTEMWCRSCLRAGHREPRTNRYTTDGVCRWCGDFHAEHQHWPPLTILDTRHAGQRITHQMITEALTTPKKKRRKR